MSTPESVELMVLKVQELEDRALNATLYDTRPHEDATFTSFVGATDGDDSAEAAEWREQSAEVEEVRVVQYIDHEWRDVMALYSDDGLVKTGERLDAEYVKLLVKDPNALGLRIDRLPNGYHVTVTGASGELYEQTYSDSVLGLEEFSPE